MELTLTDDQRAALKPLTDAYIKAVHVEEDDGSAERNLKAFLTLLIGECTFDLDYAETATGQAAHGLYIIVQATRDSIVHICE